VIDVGDNQQEIVAGIARALTPEFRAAIRDAECPFGDGHSAEKIVKVLAEWPLQGLLIKQFHDLA
jgi:UDP-N-acetylglucosamine 2-epimerase